MGPDLQAPATRGRRIVSGRRGSAGQGYVEEAERLRRDEFPDASGFVTCTLAEGSVVKYVRALSKWPSAPRLETRTTESNILASVWVAKPERTMKVKDACRLWWEPVKRCTIARLLIPSG